MQDVSERTGLCRQTVSSVESGSGKIGMETYLLVANAVGVDLTAVVASQTYRRAQRPILVMDHYHGTTDDGTEFTVTKERKGLCLTFRYDGKDYSEYYSPRSYEYEVGNMDLTDYRLRCYVQERIRELELGEVSREIRGHE